MSLRNFSPRQQRAKLTPAEREAERKRRYRWGLVRSVGMLIGLIVLAVLLTRRPVSPQVLSVTPAKALDDTYRAIEPTETFAPGDTFFVSVELRGYRLGMDLVARWRYEGQVITETPLVAEGSGEGYAGFSLSPHDPPQWPVGQYMVDILYEDKLLGRTVFNVAAGE